MNKNILIVDMSSFQYPKLINYDLLCSQADGFILRSAYGYWKDKAFETHYAEIHKRGKPIGEYPFLVNYQPAADQFATVQAACTGKEFKLGHWCDAELEEGAEPLTAKRVIDFMTIAEKEMGEWGVYTGNWCWYRIMGKEYARYKTRKVWMSAYTGTPVGYIPTGWENWFLWQYTDSGRLSGYGKGGYNLDMSRFNGTDQEFTDWCGHIPVTPPAPEPKNITVPVLTVRVPSLSIRSDAGTNCQWLGYVKAGTEVAILETKEVGSDIWARVGVNQWCAMKYNGADYIE